MTPDFLLAQISDLHLTTPEKLAYGRIDTRTPWYAALQSLRNHTPKIDALLISGDLVQRGNEAVYTELGEMLDALGLPVYVITGNHDRRELLRQALPKHTYLPALGKLDWCVNDYPLAIIGLDALHEGEGAGYFGEAQLDWLEQQLQQLAGKPTVIAVHQPPIQIGIDHMDSAALRGGLAQFEAIVSRHAHVKRVLCGHVHRYCVAQWANTLVMTAPGCAHQVDLNFSADVPPHYRLEPPGVLLHACFGTEIVTHYRPLNPGVERQPFY